MWAAVLVASALAAATTAQDAASLDLETTLCDGNSAGDFFRLSATTCRDVYACTSERRLHALRCPTGLAFDVERQTCDWSHTVHNCHVLRVSHWILWLPIVLAFPHKLLNQFTRIIRTAGKYVVHVHI
jgi:hypothetical protein